MVGGYGSDRDDGDGELGSDAENDDISEVGDTRQGVENDRD